VKGIDIGVEAELVMDLGLSSILDLTHKETNYQAYIFSHQERHDIEFFFFFNDKYQAKEVPALSPIVTKHCK
jgi:hypothetical protein